MYGPRPTQQRPGPTQQRPIPGGYWTPPGGYPSLGSSPTVTVHGQTLPFNVDCLYTTLSRGMSGECVRILQQLLNVHGAMLTVDGQFGPLTQNSVVQFQAQNGLVQDGIVGPQTWRALYR